MNQYVKSKLHSLKNGKFVAMYKSRLYYPQKTAHGMGQAWF